MIKCISYWSTPNGLSHAEPIYSALKLSKDAGFEGIELCLGTPAPGSVLHTESTQAECEAIRKQVDASGLKCETLAAGLTWGVNPTSNDKAVREQSIALHAAALERASWLGCQAMLMVPGVVNSPISPDEHVRYDHALERCREALKPLLETAERVGVDLCIENVWNGMFYSPVEFRDFVDSFNHPRLGVYFDCGNVLGYHQRPDHWIEILDKRIRRVHIKGYRESFGFDGTYSFCGLLDGDVPWPATMQALKKIGYARTVVAEMLPFSEGLLEKTSSDMDQLFAM